MNGHLQFVADKDRVTTVAMDTLVVFDFDWSLIDCNSDTWVVEKLGAMERMKSFQETLPWTQLMVLLDRSVSISVFF